MSEVFTYIGYFATVFGLIVAIITLYKHMMVFFDNRFSWNRIESGVSEIVRSINKEEYNPDVIVGIGRSGGIIGGLIAGFLGAKPFTVLNCTYGDIKDNNGSLRKVSFDEEFTIANEYKKILLVEGATTSGETPKAALEYMKKKFDHNKEFRFAVIVKEKRSSAPINYSAYSVDKIKKLPWHVPEWPTHL